MREEIINGLPPVLRKHICTLRKASEDKTNREVMCESSLKVIDFDKIPNEFARGKGWNSVPQSNDALYVDVDQKWNFIEFKNGKAIKMGDIYRKIYDSLIMLMEWNIIPDFDYVRKNVNYILVYNEEKQEKVPASPSLKETYGYVMNRARQEEKLFGIDKLEKYLFWETHTYTKDLFEEKFIQVKEREEL